VLELLAELRFKQDEFAAAADLFELGVAHDPDHIPWWKGLAVSLRKTSDQDKLKPVLERLVVIDGDDAAPRRVLARMALDNKEFAEAVRYARLALHIDVLDVETHRILAQAYAGLKQFSEAADEWSVALQLKPGEPDFEIELSRVKKLRDETK
jgi:Tfp pilus assembly protein PilF